MSHEVIFHWVETLLVWFAWTGGGLLVVWFVVPRVLALLGASWRQVRWEPQQGVVREGAFPIQLGLFDTLVELGYQFRGTVRVRIWFGPQGWFDILRYRALVNDQCPWIVLIFRLAPTDGDRILITTTLTDHASITTANFGTDQGSADDIRELLACHALKLAQVRPLGRKPLTIAAMLAECLQSRTGRAPPLSRRQARRKLRELIAVPLLVATAALCINWQKGFDPCYGAMLIMLASFFALGLELDRYEKRTRLPEKLPTPESIAIPSAGEPPAAAEDAIQSGQDRIQRPQ